MQCKCRVCGKYFYYTDKIGYDTELCGPFCDGKESVLKAVQPVVTMRNTFEGPSLDYMQGYRDGQQFVQNELRVILQRFMPKAAAKEEA